MSAQNSFIAIVDGHRTVSEGLGVLSVMDVTGKWRIIHSISPTETKGLFQRSIDAFVRKFLSDCYEPIENTVHVRDTLRVTDLDNEMLFRVHRKYPCLFVLKNVMHPPLYTDNLQRSCVLSRAMDAYSNSIDKLAVYDYMYSILSDIIENGFVDGSYREKVLQMMLHTLTIPISDLIARDRPDIGPVHSLVIISRSAVKKRRVIAGKIIRRVMTSAIYKAFSGHDQRLWKSVVSICHDRRCKLTSKSIRYMFCELSMMASKYSDRLLGEHILTLSQEM